MFVDAVYDRGKQFLEERGVFFLTGADRDKVGCRTVAARSRAGTYVHQQIV